MTPFLFQNKVKSNLPRDDINLQFCRGVLKDKRAMLEEMKVNTAANFCCVTDVDALMLTRLTCTTEKFFRAKVFAENHFWTPKPSFYSNLRRRATCKFNLHGTKSHVSHFALTPKPTKV